MKKIIFISIVAFFCSCGQKKYEKPFTITGKGYTDGKCVYYYQDANGYLNYFLDLDKYSVGDTIR